MTGTALDVHTRVRDLVGALELPSPTWVDVGGHDTAVLRVASVEHLLAWAGEMSGEPAWWCVRYPDRTDVHGAGVVRDLPVSLATATTSPVPDRPGTHDVLELAVVAALPPRRPSPHPRTPR